MERAGQDTESPTSQQSKGRQLGQRLIETGVISEEHLKLALRRQRIEHKLLGQILVELGFVDEDTINALLSTSDSTPYVDVRAIEVAPEVLAMVPMETALKHALLPIDADERRIRIVIDDPANVAATDEIWKLTRRRVELATAPRKDILRAIERLYHNRQTLDELVDQLIAIDTDNLDDSDTSPVVRFVDQMIAHAARSRATDIHIEPESRILRIRIRVDGQMHNLVLLPIGLHPYITSRIKVLADIDLTERNLPQDGRFTADISGRSIEIRVSSLRSAHGDRIVLRLLNKDDIFQGLENLGMPPAILQATREEIARTHGVTLVSGPTGSGKTTTLYAMLLELDRAAETIMTAEDPVEYQVDGVQQVPVNEEIGLTFASVLRALLRQDPDKIMVGEIRDRDTADIAFRAGMTGHLVLSSIHTNSSLESIYRLFDIGIEPFLVASTLNAVLAQRLVRRLCPQCAEPLPESIARAAIEQYGLSPGEPAFKRPKGCNHCQNTGYRGRLGVFEIWRNGPAFHEAIVNRLPPAEMLELAREHGFRTMFEDGMDKAARGQTSIEEVLKVTSHARLPV